VDVEGALVNFVVSEGSGTVWAGAALTDDSGIAREWWTLGTRTSETQVLEVRVVGRNGTRLVYGTFTATALPGPAARTEVVAATDTVTAELLPALGPPGLRVMDAYGNPVEGSPVQFEVLFGAASSVQEGSFSTDVNGVVYPAWTMGAYDGDPFFVTQTIRMYADALPDSSSERWRTASVRVYRTEGLLLERGTHSDYSDTGSTMICAFIAEGESALEPSDEHILALQWKRNSVPIVPTATGRSEHQVCAMIPLVPGFNVLEGLIRGMQGSVEAVVLAE